MQRARTWVALAASLAALVGLSLALVAWRAHRSLSERPEEVLAGLSAAVGLPVEADGVRVTWWPPGLVVHGIRIPDRSPLGPGDLVHADEARLVVRSWPLLWGSVVVKRVEISTPVIRMVRGVDGAWNLSGDRAAERAPADPTAGTEIATAAPVRVSAATSVLWEHPVFDVADVVIRRGRISLRDRAIPGVPEFEITSTEARLERRADGSTLDFQGRALDGPAGNLQGTLQIPQDGADVALTLTAREVPARRIPEVMQLARGGIPFGAALDGVVSADVSGWFPHQWPPGPGAIGVLIDANEASATIADGYLRKPVGMPLAIALELRAGSELLQLRRAAFQSGEARVEMSADVADVVDLASARQPVLRIASENLNADLLSDWIPLLGAVAPSGALSLSGTIAPGEPESAVQVRLSGSDLGIRIGRERAELGGAAVDFDLHPEGHFTAGLSIEDVTSEDLFASRLTAAFEGGGEEPVRLRIDGARGGRADARIDRVAIECALTGDRAEVRRLEVAGLGGTLLAQGELARDEGDVLAVRFAPQWDGVDFAGFLRLFGVDLDIQGLFTGQAALAARRSAEETFLETLSGVFDVRLTEGSVQDLNLARTTVANLGAIPGVRQAIERRAEEKIPELLARTSRIEALQVAGSVADGAVSVDRLELDAPDYSLDAKGRVALDGGVDLDGHLVLGERATEALASASVVLAMLARGGEPIRIPIRVAGTYPDLVSAPSPAFVTESIAGSAAGAAGGGAGGFLRNLLGGGREAGRSAGDGRE